MKSLMSTLVVGVSAASSTLSLVKIPYSSPLLAATFVRRVDRFVCECTIEDEIERAHCVNPGRMEDFVREGATIWLSRSDNEKRKLKFTWELLEYPRPLIGEVPENGGANVIICGTNTQRPNNIVAEVIEKRVLSGLDTWDSFRSEVTLDESGFSGEGESDESKGEKKQKEEIKDQGRLYADRG